MDLQTNTNKRERVRRWEGAAHHVPPPAGADFARVPPEGRRGALILKPWVDPTTLRCRELTAVGVKQQRAVCANTECESAVRAEGERERWAFTVMAQRRWCRHNATQPSEEDVNPGGGWAWIFRPNGGAFEGRLSRGPRLSA